LAIIHKGELMAQGSVEEIKGLVKERFRVVVEGSLKALEKYINNNSSVSFGNRRIIYVGDGDEAIELVRKALENGLKAEASPITLEDVFVKLVGGEENEARKNG
jgi:ABC-type multidrug transport system ATPase subunit